MHNVKNRHKHVFRQDVHCLRYAALGDTSVRAVAIRHLIDVYELDAVVVPQPNSRLIPLWHAVLGHDRVVLDPSAIPAEFRDATVSAPTGLDWAYGAAAWNVFESVMWENGFFDTISMKITPPVVFRSQQRDKAVMIYPVEATDGNRVFDATWWINACRVLREGGYRINYLGETGYARFKPLYEAIEFDGLFEPTIDGLRKCVAASSLAIGGSTGPTWTLLLSDIPQIVLESRRSPHGYWFFQRCQPVLTKRLTILPTLECLPRLIERGF